MAPTALPGDYRVAAYVRVIETGPIFATGFVVEAKLPAKERDVSMRTYEALWMTQGLGKSNGKKRRATTLREQLEWPFKVPWAES